MAAPVTTEWVRPDSCSKNDRASSRSLGLPNVLVPSATIVSAANTTASGCRGATAKALRRALKSVSSHGVRKSAINSVAGLVTTVKRYPALVRRCARLELDVTLGDGEFSFAERGLLNVVDRRHYRLPEKLDSRANRHPRVFVRWN